MPEAEYKPKALRLALKYIITNTHSPKCYAPGVTRIFTIIDKLCPMYPTDVLCIELCPQTNYFFLYFVSVLIYQCYCNCVTMLTECRQAEN